MRAHPVAELMHVGEELPLVVEQAGMPDVISVITRCRFGLAGVVDERGELIGVVTDGDLRRHFAALNSALAGGRDDPLAQIDRVGHAGGATRLMFLNDAKITAAFVVNRPRYRASGSAGRDRAYPRSAQIRAQLNAGSVTAVRFAILIPARFASQRFPGKPLAPLVGASGLAKPLIQRAWEAALCGARRGSGVRRHR